MFPNWETRSLEETWAPIPAEARFNLRWSNCFPAGTSRLPLTCQWTTGSLTTEARVKVGRQRLLLLIEYKDLDSEARLREAIEVLRNR